MGFGHSVIASSPIDVNLAKQINILLENLGMPANRMLIDPTTGGLGYGLEYSYSVMERIRMAALAQGDDKLQLPLINNLGNEVWKSKEAKQGAAEAPTLGDPERRAVLMESVGAVAYLMSGSNILIMRHPEAVRLVKSFIELIYKGGAAKAVAPIAKKLPAADIDLLSLSPAPNLAIAEEKEKKAAAAPPPPKAAAAPKAEAKPAPTPPKAEAAPAAPAADEAALKAKAEADAKAKAEVEARAKLDAAARAKAEAEAKAKAEADAKAAAEAEVKAKAAAEAQRLADQKAKVEADLDKIRQQRTKEREDRAAAAPAKAPVKTEKKAAAPKDAEKKAAVPEKSVSEKIVETLVWVHRRNR
jgi:acetyl-CoA decarbonylase/synthase complex subunit delta